MAQVTCPHCDAKQETEAKTGELVRCSTCGKPFEVGMKLRTRPAPQRPPAQPVARQEQQPAPQIRTPKPPVDMYETEFAAGLQIAALVVGVAYFMLLMALFGIGYSIFVKGSVLQALVVSAGIVFSAFSLLLFGHTSKAVMKSADYLRIIAKRMD